MPVIYRIDAARGLIRTKCVGNVTFPEVMDHFRQLEKDPDCPLKLDVLLDFREMVSLPTDLQLSAVSEEIARIRRTVQFGACAIVASSDALFGTAKVFEVVAARAFRVTNVFRGPAAAEVWLEEQRTSHPPAPK
jgi:hypothetical protein